MHVQVQLGYKYLLNLKLNSLIYPYLSESVQQSLSSPKFDKIVCFKFGSGTEIVELAAAFGSATVVMQLLPLFAPIFLNQKSDFQKGAKLVVEELSGKEIVELFWF